MINQYYPNKIQYLFLLIFIIYIFLWCLYISIIIYALKLKTLKILKSIYLYKLEKCLKTKISKKILRKNVNNIQ